MARLEMLAAAAGLVTAGAIAFVGRGRLADFAADLAAGRAFVRATAAAPAAPKPDRHRFVIGFREYDGLCASCHSYPGGGRQTWADGLDPPPPDLVRPDRTLSTRDIFATVCEGVKGSGMAAFRGHRSNDEIWDIALFVSELPKLPAARYASLRTEYGPAPQPLGLTPDSDCYLKKGTLAHGR